MCHHRESMPEWEALARERFERDESERVDEDDADERTVDELSPPADD